MYLRRFFLVFMAIAFFPKSGSLAHAATPGEYGPVFQETGLSAVGDYFSPGPQVTVNRLSGNLVVQAKDVALPGIGAFGLIFERTHNSGGAFSNTDIFANARRVDSPLGIGWTSHYGYLRYNPHIWPELVDSTGGREPFYVHNRLTELAPGTATTRWISRTLDILMRTNDDGFVLYSADGRRTIFTLATGDIYVPTSIADSAGNSWEITYAARWWTDYARMHPTDHA